MSEESSPPSEPVFRRKPRPPIDLPPDEPLRRRAVPYILAVAFAALLGLGSESVRSVEAIVAAAAFPLVMLYAGLGALRTSTKWVSWAGIGVALVTAVSSEYFLVREFYPPAALAQTSVGLSQPDVTVSLPDSERRFEVMVRGKLHGDSGAAEARYAIELKRGAAQDRVEGEMTRHVGSAPRRSVSMTRGSASTAQESGRFEVNLDGTGPVALHLAYLGNGARNAMDVTFYPRGLAEKTVAIGFAALVAVGFLAQSVAARNAIKTRLAGAAAIVGAYTIYVQRYLNADDPLLTVLPAMVVSFVLGGLVGLVLGTISGLLTPKKSIGAA